MNTTSVKTRPTTTPTINCKEDQNCRANFDGWNFCNFKTKQCERRYRGCQLSMQEEFCLLFGTGTIVADNIACMMIARKLDRIQKMEKQKTCRRAIKTIETIGKVACNLSLEYLCDLRYCPENFNKTSCNAINANL